MSAPLVGPPPANPIRIDPGVSYKYVVPVQGETAISVDPAPGWTLAIAGRTLTASYSGLPPGIDRAVAILLHASNGDGITDHPVNFLVKGGAVISIDPSFQAACVSGSNNLRFGTPDTAPAVQIPINGRLLVGSKIKARTRTHGLAVTGIDAAALYVIAVNDALGYFQVSATSGGAVITPDNTSTYEFVNALGVNTLPDVFVGDTSKFYAGQPVTVTYSDGVALPANFVGAKFVKAIIDPYNLTLASTLGGVTLNANADSFPTDENVRILADTTGSRFFPAITNASQQSITEGAPIVDLLLTADIAPDSFAVLGLPSGLGLTGGDTITGTPIGTLQAQYAVTLIAYRGSFASYRYWLLNITLTGATSIDLPADAILDVAEKQFYTTVGRRSASRIERTLADVPLLLAFQKSGDDITLPVGTQLRFSVKPQGHFDAPGDLVAGAYTVPADPPALIGLSESWDGVDLRAQFDADQTFLEFTGQLEYRFPSDPADTWRSVLILVRVYNSNFGGGLGTPGMFIGAVPYTDLLGAAPTDLQAVDTLPLPIDSRLAAVVRLIGGASTLSIWMLKAGTDATDTALGILRGHDYAGATNEKVWVRVSGV